MSLIEDILLPLSDLPIAETYLRFASVINFFLYLVIFLGLAEALLAKRFADSRGGKSVAIGVGISLALGLVVLEHRMGFNLIVQFGAYASGIFMILTSTLLFYLLKTLNVGGSAAFSVAYLTAFYLTKAAIPDFLDNYVRTRAPWLYALLALGALLSLVTVIWQIVAHFSPSHMPRISARIEEAPVNALKKGAQAAGLALERRLLKGSLAGIQRQRTKDASTLIQDLSYIGAAITKHGNSPENRRVIAQTLSRDVIPTEHKLEASLRELGKLYRRVERLDIGMLSKLKSLPSAQKQAAEEEIKTELQKLAVENSIKRYYKQMAKWDSLFRDRIKKAVKEINENNLDAANDTIQEAINSQKEILKLDDEIEKLRKLLLGLTNREIKKE